MLTQTNQKIGDFDCVVVRDSECETPSAVVILCHGFGAPGTDLVSIGSELLGVPNANKDVVYIFPAAPIVLDPLFDGRAWWMIDIEKIQQLMMQGDTREMRSESPDLLPDRRASMIHLIDLCRVDFNVEPSRIIIGGFSQGSMLATDVALHHPDKLGGLIVWSGSFINESVWTKRMKEISEGPDRLVVVQSHGRLDPILPMTGAESLRDFLSENGHEVRFYEFNGGHSIPTEAIQLAIQLIDSVAKEV